jgi:hypothetical protein
MSWKSYHEYVRVCVLLPKKDFGVVGFRSRVWPMAEKKDHVKGTKSFSLHETMKRSGQSVPDLA